MQMNSLTYLFGILFVLRLDDWLPEAVTTVLLSQLCDNNQKAAKQEAAKQGVVRNIELHHSLNSLQEAAQDE